MGGQGGGGQLPLAEPCSALLSPAKPCTALLSPLRTLRTPLTKSCLARGGSRRRDTTWLGPPVDCGIRPDRSPRSLLRSQRPYRPDAPRKTSTFCCSPPCGCGHQRLIKCPPPVPRRGGRGNSLATASPEVHHLSPCFPRRSNSTEQSGVLLTWFQARARGTEGYCGRSPRCFTPNVLIGQMSQEKNSHILLQPPCGCGHQRLTKCPLLPRRGGRGNSRATAPPEVYNMSPLLSAAQHFDRTKRRSLDMVQVNMWQSRMP